LQEAWIAQLRNDISRLSRGASAEAPARVLVPGERRNVVTLFIDLEGFTELSENLDHESVHALAGSILGALAAIVETNGGIVDKYEGDRLMALFGAEVSSEDDCIRAVHCASGMMTAVGEIASALEERGLRTGARIGISYGSVTVAPDPGGHITAMGDEVNVASRLEQAAGSGCILATTRVRDECRGFFMWEDRGELPIRGRRRPVSACRLLGFDPDAVESQPARPPFTGRADELERALGFLEGAPGLEANPRGFPRHRILVITGAEGSGKTRLLDELISELQVKAPVMVLRGDAGPASLQRTHWWEPAGDEACPDAKGGHGLSESAQDRVLANRIAIRDSIRSLSTTGRVVLAVDGWQWLDDAARETVEFVLRTCDSSEPLLLAVCARSSDPADPAGPAIHPNYAETLALDLHPLEDDAASTLAMAAMGATEEQDLPAGLLESITTAAKGNPRYLGALVSDLIETGRLMRKAEGWVLTSGLDGSSVPGSIAGLIRARLDRMPPDTRRALQLASVLGDIFPAELFTATSGALGFHDPESLLVRLESLGLIAVEGGTVKAADPLAFQISRDSILNANRSLMHEAAVEALEGMEESCAGWSWMMSVHLAGAGRTLDAASWAAEAAEEEEMSARPDRALALALEAWRLLGDGRGEKAEQILLGLGRVIRRSLYRAGADQGIRDALAASAALNEAGTKYEEASAQHLALCEYHRRAGDLEGARVLAEKALSEAGLSGSRERRARATAALAGLLMHADEFERAAMLYEEALEILGSERHSSTGIAFSANLASCLMSSGSFEPAERCLMEVLSAQGRELDLRGRAGTLVRLGVLRGRQRDFEKSRTLLEEAVSVSIETGDRSTLSTALGNLGVTAIQSGDTRLASKSLRHALAVSRELGNRRSESMCLLNLAKIASGEGELDQAEALAAEAVEVNRISGSRLSEVESLAVLGRIRLARSSAAEARELYVLAVDAASRIAGQVDSLPSLTLLREALLESGEEASSLPEVPSTRGTAG
jgi:class 3 adenylate cyclase/tetratricopeptide (TPR) repeat protein